MVANIRSGSSPGGALRYNKEKVDKDEAEVLLWQKMLEPFDKHGRLDIDACMDSFWPYLEANRRTTNTVFHASLNPSPEDRLTDEQLREIANEYMQKMGYGDQPYIVFKHKDIDRQHLHIVSLRVDEKGCKLPHDFEARRSAEITRDLEHNRSRFIVKRIFAEEFVVVKRDPSKVQFIARLNDFYFQFQKLANNYNQIVKVINSHFSNIAIPHQIAALEQRTRELKALSIEILNLAKQAKEWLRI